MKTNIVSVGDVKQNVNVDGWNCYVRVQESSVNFGVTVFGDSREEVLQKLGGVGVGDVVEFDVERKGKFFNVVDGITLLEKAMPQPVEEPLGQQKFDIPTEEVAFKPASMDSKRDSRKHEAALITQDAVDVFEKQLQRKPEHIGDFELLTAIFKYLAWRE